MRHLVRRGLLAVLTSFLALTTIVGAVLVVPTLPLDWLDGSVFHDYTVPATTLAFVGALSVVAFGLTFVRPDLAGMAAVAAGLAMVTFEVVEIWVVGFSLAEYGVDEPVAWLQVAYILIGLVTAGVGLGLWRSTVGERGRVTRTASASAASGGAAM